MINIRQKIIRTVATTALLASIITPQAFADTIIRISGNGSRSDNSVSIRRNSSFSVSQSNSADIENTVRMFVSTGGNHANDNTGGRVSVHSGSIHSLADIFNFLNFNLLRFGR